MKEDDSLVFNLGSKVNSSAIFFFFNWNGEAREVTGEEEYQLIVLFWTLDIYWYTQANMSNECTDKQNWRQGVC